MSDNQYFEKTVAEEFPYFINWADLLASEDDGDGDEINTSAWASSPSGLTLTQESVDNNNTRAVVKVSGGDDGVKYTLVNTITTDDGSIFEGFIEILVRNYG